MIHQALRLRRPLYDLSFITMNMAWLSKWHYTEPCISQCCFWWRMAPNLSTHTVTQEERGHTRHFAFNEDSTEHKHSPVIALKSLIAVADGSDDKKTTSVNICFGNWNWPWNGTLTLFSVFMDQLGLTDLHSRINLKTITAPLLFLLFDSSVAPLALENSKPPDLKNIFASSRIHPWRCSFF